MFLNLSGPDIFFYIKSGKSGFNNKNIRPSPKGSIGISYIKRNAKK